MSPTLFARVTSMPRLNRMRPRVLFALTTGLFFVLGAGSPAHAQYGVDDTTEPGNGPAGPRTEAALVAETQTIRPGQPFTVALRLNLEKEWHVYWRNPGDSGTPTGIKWSLPPGFRAGAIQWPVPQKFVSPGLVAYGYENEVWLLTQITPPANLTHGKTVALGADADWLVCSEQCVPQKKHLTLQLDVSSDVPAPDQTYKRQFAAARSRLPVLAAQSGFTVRADSPAGAKPAKASLNLRIVSAPKTPVSAEQLKALYFYPADESTLSHPATQKVVKEGTAYRVPLTTSEYASEPLKRLRGVLIAPSDKTNGSAALARGIWIDVPITASPATPKK